MIIRIRCKTDIKITDVYPNIIGCTDQILSINSNVFKNSKQFTKYRQNGSIVILTEDTPKVSKPISKHNLFVNTSHTDPQDNMWIKKLIESIDQLSIKIEGIQHQQIVEKHIPIGKSQKDLINDIPVYIPEIHTGAIKDTNIKIKEQSDVSDLSDVENNLRRLLRRD